MRPQRGTASSDGRHISGMTTAVIVRWVRGLLGEQAVRALLDRAGETRPLAEVEDPASWSTYQQAVALLEAAVAVSGRPDAARRVGEEMLAQHRGTPLLDLLRSVGSPEALLTSIAESGTKFSTVLRLQPREVAPGRAVVTGGTPEGIPRHRLLCDFTTGILTVVPSVFGMDPAVVTESACQARGDACCVYHLAWDPASSPDSDPQRRIRYLESELQGLRRRVASLQRTAADIGAAHDLNSSLRAIAARAAAGVGTTAYLLAVRLHPGGELMLFGDGCRDERQLGEQLLADDLGDDDGGARIVVDVRSGSRGYGRLAAFYPPGTKCFSEERDIMLAYAGHAAAVCDTAAALDEAVRQNRTARALLHLSGALSYAGDRQEVARRLVAAVPELVDCDRSTVLLWEETTQRLHLAAAYGEASPYRERLVETGISVGDTPYVEALLRNPTPLFLRGDEPDPFLRSLVAQSGSALIAVVPIVGHGRFHGVVTAEVTHAPERLRPDDDLLERMAGIAHHGAIALENATFVDQLRSAALHDGLTGLPNRTLLLDRLERALAATTRAGGRVALMFLDLDRFKEVNDVFGHMAGDALLTHVARRLSETLRPQDTLARLGGDEFAVLLPEVADEQGAVQCGQRLLAALEPAFALDGTEFFVSASIGVALGRGRDTEALALLRQADTAMYAAKSRGGAVFELAGADHRDASRRRLMLESALRQALAGEQMTVVYQPVVDLAHDAVVAVEALVRWRHPELSVLHPPEFLDVAEEIGVVVDIDLWVLQESCRQLRTWLDGGLAAPRMAVNLSARTMRSPRLAAVVDRELADGRLAGLVELEISERILDDDLIEGADRLAHLADLGVTLAIDDFGTGNSSFARLHHRFVDTLKIDRTFLREVRAVDEAAPMLDALLRLGRELGLRVIAEGVERAEQRAWLRRHGCRLAQGYLLGRPGPPEPVAAALPAATARVATPAG